MKGSVGRLDPSAESDLGLVFPVGRSEYVGSAGSKHAGPVGRSVKILHTKRIIYKKKPVSPKLLFELFASAIIFYFFLI